MKRNFKQLYLVIFIAIIMSLLCMNVSAADSGENVHGDMNSEIVHGDINGDSAVNIDDVIYLLKHTMLPSKYPIVTQHTYQVTIIAPTCTSKGYTTYTCACGDTYTEEADATGHSHNAVVTAPTCTAKGYTTYTCHCGDAYVGDEVSELGHTEVIDEAVVPNCTATGLSEGKHCSVCNEVLVEQEIISANGHRFGEWVVSREATEASKGEIRRNCASCDHFETDVVAELAHDHNRWERTTLPAVAPTCTTTGLTEGKKCSECNEILVAQEVVSATGEHSFEEWQTVKEATTAEEGLMERVCGCGEKETQTIEKIKSELSYTLNEDGQSYSVTQGTWKGTWLVIPETYNGLPVTVIPKFAFRGNSTIETIIIPDSVTTIESLAFISCPSLKQIEIGSGVTSIGMNLFENSNSVKNIVVSDENPVFDSRNYCSAIIETSSNTLVIGCGHTCIPDTVETIGNAAFALCESLTSIEIPKSVTHVDFQAFHGCTNLTTVYYAGNKFLWNRINIDNGFGANQPLLDATLVCTGEDEFLCESYGEGSALFAGFSPNVAIPSVTQTGEAVIAIASETFVNLHKLIIEIPITIQYIHSSAFKNCDTVEIYYSGTSAEWECISFGHSWHISCNSVTVICSDNTIYY